MKTKEQSRQANNEVVEKLKSGLSHKTLTCFKCLTDHCSVHHLKLK